MATTPGTITSFTPTPKGTLDIGGTGYTVETAGKGYSLTQVDPRLCNSKFKLAIRLGSMAAVLLIARKFKINK